MDGNIPSLKKYDGPGNFSFTNSPDQRTYAGAPDGADRTRSGTEAGAGSIPGADREAPDCPEVPEIPEV